MMEIAVTKSGIFLVTKSIYVFEFYVVRGKDEKSDVVKSKKTAFILIVFTVLISPQLLASPTMAGITNPTYAFQLGKTWDEWWGLYKGGYKWVGDFLGYGDGGTWTINDLWFIGGWTENADDLYAVVYEVREIWEWQSGWAHPILDARLKFEKASRLIITKEYATEYMEPGVAYNITIVSVDLSFTTEQSYAFWEGPLLVFVIKSYYLCLQVGDQYLWKTWFVGCGPIQNQVPYICFYDPVYGNIWCFAVPRTTALEWRIEWGVYSEAVLGYNIELSILPYVP